MTKGLDINFQTIGAPGEWHARRLCLHIALNYIILHLRESEWLLRHPGGAERPYMDLIIVTPSPKINFATSYSVQGRPYMEVIFITSSEVSETGGGVGAAHIWK